MTYDDRKLIDVVDDLLSLNDDNLAERVILNNDVQWCLSELYGILVSFRLNAEEDAE